MNAAAAIIAVALVDNLVSWIGVSAADALQQKRQLYHSNKLGGTCSSFEGGECGGDGSEAFYCRNFTSLCEECTQNCKDPTRCPFVACVRENYEEQYCNSDKSVCSRCPYCEEPEVCPPRCNCSSHDDCEKGEFCPKDWGGGKPGCLPCEQCDPSSQYEWTMPVGDACPSQCFCSTSDDCGSAKYCSRCFDPARCIILVIGLIGCTIYGRKRRERCCQSAEADPSALT